MTYSVIAYETADLEIVMGTWRGNAATATHHAMRRARYFEQEVTTVRVVGEGLTIEQANALVRSASPFDGVEVKIP